jgi:hypothetical protein
VKPALVAVIPSRYEPERLRSLLAVVTREADLTVIIDTGHAAPVLAVPDPAVLVVPADPNASIYSWWNLGWRIALEWAPTVDVAILNDDVRLRPGTLRLLARALRSRPDVGVVYPDARVRTTEELPRRVVLSVERDPLGGREMTGYCFVARGELPLDPPFDEGYRWWYGDTQFDEAVRLVGFAVARVNRVPVDHASDAEADGWMRRPELREWAEEDGLRFDELHQRVRDGAWWPVATKYRRT